jgi:hypothetical protein
MTISSRSPADLQPGRNQEPDPRETWVATSVASVGVIVVGHGVYGVLQTNNRESGAFSVTMAKFKFMTALSNTVPELCS